MFPVLVFGIHGADTAYTVANSDHLEAGAWHMLTKYGGSAKLSLDISQVCARTKHVILLTPCFSWMFLDVQSTETVLTVFTACEKPLKRFLAVYAPATPS